MSETLSIFAKFLFVTLCSGFISFKLIKKSVSPFFVALSILYCTLIGAVVTLSQIHFAMLSIPIKIFFLFWLNKFIYKLNANKTMEYTVIGIAISHLLYILCLFGYLIFEVIIGLLTLPKINIPVNLIVGILQLITAFFLFKIKRFKKGLPYLNNNSTSTDFDVYISLFILCIIILIDAGFNEVIALSFFVAVLIILGLFLIFWWRHRTNNLYKSKLHSKEIDELNQKISLLNDEICELKQENEVFSKLIHKDNKIIPAMLFSVEELLSSISKQDDEEILLQKANELANELHSISKNRIGIIENCENNENKLISTNIKSLDIMLFYMQNKAKKANILFNSNIAQNIDISAFNGVLENDLSTLLADLLENAIIAVNKSTNLSKKIGIEVGCKGDIPYISIFDSAEPFANEVISNYGKQRYTTHKNEGGSGIGLMSVYEICQKYGASFHIINLVQDGYRKSVSVLFDNKNEFITR